MVSFKWLETYVGDLDVFFAYRTARTVAIRDRRLGLTLLVLQLIIAGYVILYQVVLSQNYMSPSDLVGSVRLQMQSPKDARFKWVNGAAPYCAGVTSLDPRNGPRANFYALEDGSFAYTGGGSAEGAVFFPQRNCTYYDETSAIPLAETDRVFLTSEERTTVQTVNASVCAAAEAAYLSSPACVFYPPYNKNDAAVTRRSFVADIEWFTLLVDHNMNAPLARLSYTVEQMAGRIMDGSGNDIDPCATYIKNFGACPDFIAVGVAGLPDILSIRNLMEAAGIDTLDRPLGAAAPGQPESSREQGIVLLLDISYSNLYLGGVGSAKLGTGTLDNSVVSYTYKVTTIPNTEYKFVTSASPYNNESQRVLYNRHGVRIIVTTSGKVGYFNVMLALVNLSVSFSLFAVATYIMDYLLLSCCPLRSLYRQYKERTTIDITDLRKAVKERPEAMARLEELLNKDPFIVDPVPAALQRAMGVKEKDVTREASRVPLLSANNTRNADDDLYLASH